MEMAPVFKYLVTRLLIPAIVFLVVASGMPVRAQHVRGYVSEDSVAIGDRFYFSLVAEHDPGLTANLPTTWPDSTLGDLEFVDPARAAKSTFTRTTTAGMQVDSLVFEVTTFALDTAIVLPVEVTFTGDGQTFTASSQPLFVKVRSLVPKDAGEIRDLAPLIDFPRNWWPWIALAALATIVVGLLMRYTRKLKRDSVPIPIGERYDPEVSPFDEAMARLKRLEQVDLYQDVAIKPFYVELSDLLRTYIERRLRIPALETTTRELILLVRRHSERPGFDKETVLLLQSVLTRADLVKFADVRPAPGEGRDVLRDTESVLTRIETTLHPAPEQEAPVSASTEN